MISLFLVIVRVLVAAHIVVAVGGIVVGIKCVWRV